MRDSEEEGVWGTVFAWFIVLSLVALIAGRIIHGGS